MALSAVYAFDGHPHGISGLCFKVHCGGKCTGRGTEEYRAILNISLIQFEPIKTFRIPPVAEATRERYVSALPI